MSYDAVAFATHGNATSYNTSFLNYPSLTVRVVDSAGTGIAGATVIIDGSNYTTDSAGFTTEVQVAAGDYTVTINKTDYRSRFIPYTMDRRREEIEVLRAVGDYEPMAQVNVGVTVDEPGVAVAVDEVSVGVTVDEPGVAVAVDEVSVGVTVDEPGVAVDTCGG